MKKNISLMALLMAFTLVSDSYYFNTHNVSGSLGVINIPSARFYNSPAVAISFYRGHPDRKGTLTVYPYDWLEASLFYSSIKDKNYPGYNQDYKDKGFNLKFRLKKQDALPALAVGLNDIGGTGYYGSEYLVSSYALDDLDIHFGLSWGTMNHHNHLKNPVSLISNKFSERDSLVEEGGKLNLGNFFSGEGVSLFGGINYSINDNIIFKLEYDPIQTPGKIGYKDRNSNLSFGFNFLNKNYIGGIFYERGSALTFNITLRDSLFIPEHSYIKPQKKSENRFVDLVNNLRRNSVGVSKIEENEEKIYLTVTQYKHKLQQLNEIIDKSLEANNFNEEVVVQYKIAGLNVIQVDDKELRKLVYLNSPKSFNEGFSLNFRPFIAGREDFIKYAVLLEHDAEIIFSENLFFSTNFKLSVIDNFDDLTYPPPDTYPNVVRSDVKKYLNNIGENISIGRAQLEYFKTISYKNHILLSAGIYEEMFSGFGLDYLYFDPSKHVNFGFEIHQAYKRDYNFGFGTQDYKNLTYHVNLFYENRYIFPFDLKTSIGEYLAGDKGITLELSRSFRNGITFGFFTSFTDVGFDKYGEGSFDKGIFFTIPFGKNNKLTNFIWRPLTKDPASKLIRKNDIYKLVKNYSYVEDL